MAQWWELSPPTNVARVWPGVDAICGLSLLLVLSLAPRGFSSGTLVFPSPQKLTLPNSNSIWNARTRLNEFIWTPRYFVSKKAIEIFLRKCCRFLSFMPLSKNHLSTRYDKSESTVSWNIKGSLSAKNTCHLRKSIGCIVLSRKRDLS